MRKACTSVVRSLVSRTFGRHLHFVSMFHSAFFNSIIGKHQHMHFFIQHYTSLEC